MVRANDITGKVLKALKKYKYAVLILLLGIALLLLPSSSKKETKTQATEVPQTTAEDNTYAAQTEQRLTEMLSNIKELLDEIRTQQKELRTSELNMLIGQINPHFLYNTLDTIYMLARINKEETTMNMIQALSKYLRLSLSKGSEIVTVEDELENVKSYLQIRQIRNENLFTYTIDCEVDPEETWVLKLILQPLVENAIYHGIKPNGKPGIISIEGGYVGDNIFVSVKDNGVGICKDQLMEIKDSIDKHHLRAGFGISSVNDRIKLHFGAEYGLNIYSTYGCGTEIRIILPSNHA